MYGIFTYIWFIFMVNVGKYTIHGWYGIGKYTYLPFRPMGTLEGLDVIFHRWRCLQPRHKRLRWVGFRAQIAGMIKYPLKIKMSPKKGTISKASFIFQPLIFSEYGSFLGEYLEKKTCLHHSYSLGPNVSCLVWPLLGQETTCFWMNVQCLAVLWDIPPANMTCKDHPLPHSSIL